jgi:hypothetical protein
MMGKSNQRLLFTKMGYLSQILLLLVWYQSSLKKVGKDTKLRDWLFLAHLQTGPGIPDPSVARMTGVIVAPIRRIRFRP